MKGVLFSGIHLSHPQPAILLGLGVAPCPKLQEGLHLAVALYIWVHRPSQYGVRCSHLSMETPCPRGALLSVSETPCPLQYEPTMARQGPGTTQAHVYNLQSTTTPRPDIKREQVPQDDYKTISNSTITLHMNVILMGHQLV